MFETTFADQKIEMLPERTTMGTVIVGSGNGNGNGNTLVAGLSLLNGNLNGNGNGNGNVIFSLF